MTAWFLALSHLEQTILTSLLIYAVAVAPCGVLMARYEWLKAKAQRGEAK